MKPTKEELEKSEKLYNLPKGSLTADTPESESPVANLAGTDLNEQYLRSLAEAIERMEARISDLAHEQKQLKLVPNERESGVIKEDPFDMIERMLKIQAKIAAEYETRRSAAVAEVQAMADLTAPYEDESSASSDTPQSMEEKLLNHVFGSMMQQPSQGVSQGVNHAPEPQSPPAAPSSSEMYNELLIPKVIEQLPKERIEAIQKGEISVVQAHNEAVAEARKRGLPVPPMSFVTKVYNKIRSGADASENKS